MPLLVALAFVGAAAALSRVPARMPAVARGTAISPISDTWTSAALPPLVEIPRLNAAISTPRFGVAIDAATGARRDAYALGDLGADETAARLEAWIGGDSERDGLFVELAEQASRFDEVLSRFGLEQAMRTARGHVEYAEMTLREGAAARSCLGFRLAPAGAAGLRGILCPAKSDKPPAEQLACLVEAITLTEDGRGSALEAVLGAAPPRRSGAGC